MTKEKEIKINVPDGYEIDKESSTFECIKFKKIEKRLPKTWIEFCNDFPLKYGECYIVGDSMCIKTYGDQRDYFKDQNVLPNEETAKAMLALCQLIQLRDCYNDGWKPDWKNRDEIKFCIYFMDDEIQTDILYSFSFTAHRVLAFKTNELREQFLNNFKYLIEIAKPLL